MVDDSDKEQLVGGRNPSELTAAAEGFFDQKPLSELESQLQVILKQIYKRFNE